MLAPGQPAVPGVLRLRRVSARNEPRRRHKSAMKNRSIRRGTEEDGAAMSAHPQCHPFQTLRESGAGDMHRAVLELDEFTPRYTTEREQLCFWFTLNGDTEVFPTRGAPYRLKSGASIATIPPGSVWDGSWRGRQTCMLLEVGPSVLREFTRSEIVFPNNRQLTVVQDERIRYSILALHQDLLSPSPAGELFAGHLVRGVASHYLSAYCSVGRDKPRREHKLAASDLRRAQELIESRLETKPSLEELAAPLGLSVASFCRRFRASTGLPPYQYLLHARIERAKQLLRRRPQQALSELALSLGFYDQSQFSNTFRRIVGVSPRDYMRLKAA
jgi:AraC family transcriptional regulator